MKIRFESLSIITFHCEVLTPRLTCVDRELITVGRTRLNDNNLHYRANSNERRPRPEAQCGEIPTNNYIFSEVCDGVRGRVVWTLSISQNLQLSLSLYNVLWSVSSPLWFDSFSSMTEQNTKPSSNNTGLQSNIKNIIFFFDIFDS